MPGTLWTHCVIEQLKAYDIRFLSYVPDSIIEQILKLARQEAFFDILPLAREEEGIGVVIPSYRLAPANQHPAQIEDVAAAFAWVVRRIHGYGGDPRRIHTGGHSAGGHLTSLLALDERYTGKYGLSARNIRSVITLSGVYNVEPLARVFGDDPRVRREASPMQHVKAAAPRFLISYCEQDYPTLPEQAKAFDAALRSAGVASELLYVPGETHVSEIISAARKEGDLTARTIVQWIREEAAR